MAVGLRHQGIALRLPVHRTKGPGLFSGRGRSSPDARPFWSSSQRAAILPALSSGESHRVCLKRAPRLADRFHGGLMRPALQRMHYFLEKSGASGLDQRQLGCELELHHQANSTIDLKEDSSLLCAKSLLEFRNPFQAKLTSGFVHL